MTGRRAFARGARGLDAQAALGHFRPGLLGAQATFPDVVQRGGVGIRGGTTEITGLLPDGVSNVTFTLANGSRRAVAVMDPVHQRGLTETRPRGTPVLPGPLSVTASAAREAGEAERDTLEQVFECVRRHL